MGGGRADTRELLPAITLPPLPVPVPIVPPSPPLPVPVSCVRARLFARPCPPVRPPARPPCPLCAVRCATFPARCLPYLAVPPQHFLNFFPLPHRHGSLGFVLATLVASPATDLVFTSGWKDLSCAAAAGVCTYVCTYEDHGLKEERM